MAASRTAFVGIFLQDPWYQTSKVVDPLKQKFVVAAAGEMCWVHGIALESFHPKTKEQQQAEIIAVPQTAHEWQLVVGAVEKRRWQISRGRTSSGGLLLVASL